MKNILFLVLVCTAISCNLTQDVEIDLPEYTPQPVVECYLEPGKPFRLLLTRSYSFFDPFGLDSTFIEKTVIQGATVTITYDGKTINLPNIPSVETNPIKLFNYTASEIVPATVGTNYVLNINLADGGGNITAQASMLPFVPIDSIVIQWLPERDTLARALMYLTDDLNTSDYYRRMLNYSSLDSVPEQDIVTPDRFSTTSQIAFGTAYELKEGDTIFNTIYHIEKPYYDYLESVQLAILANFNPFAQPAAIKSNVTGSANPLGIFTTLVYDRDTTILKK